MAAMRLDESLATTAAFAPPTDFRNFRSRIDPDWIEECLCATGFASIRRRRLPAEQVIWLVLGMALFRHESIEYLVQHLALALPSDEPPPVRSAIANARQRLGDEPVQYLFERASAEWAVKSADVHRWRGLALFGVDGTTLRVPDSEQNRATFGSSKGRRGISGYPLVRLVVLMALRSHVLRSARMAPYVTSEQVLARQLWPDVPDQSLTIVDRAFLSAPDLIPLHQGGAGRHWLCRAKKNTRFEHVESLGRGDVIAEMQVSPSARAQLPDLPLTWRVRVIDYQRKGFPPSKLVTSLLDAKAYPAAEIVRLYHERWELEIGYDELKTHMLAREETIRSKTAVGVRQEIWGQLLAYNLVRLEMERVATEAKVAPTRISFVHAVRAIRAFWYAASLMAPGTIPRQLRGLRVDLKLLILPERAERPSYPRAVKIKMSNYARKRPRAVVMRG